MESVKPGDLVISLKGRDAGRRMIVLEVKGDSVVLADGRLRLVEKPKTKKIKHVQWKESLQEVAAEKIRAGEKVTNSQLRKTIAGFIET